MQSDSVASGCSSFFALVHESPNLFLSFCERHKGEHSQGVTLQIIAFFFPSSIFYLFSLFGTTRTQAHHFSRSRHTFPQHLQTHLLIFYCHSRRHSHSDTFRQKHFISSLSLHAENGTFCFLEVSEHALQGMPWQGQTRRGV